MLSSGHSYPSRTRRPHQICLTFIFVKTLADSTTLLSTSPSRLRSTRRPIPPSHSRSPDNCEPAEIIKYSSPLPETPFFRTLNRQRLASAQHPSIRPRSAPSRKSPSRRPLLSFPLRPLPPPASRLDSQRCKSKEGCRRKGELYSYQLRERNSEERSSECQRSWFPSFSRRPRRKRVFGGPGPVQSAKCIRTISPSAFPPRHRAAKRASFFFRSQNPVRGWLRCRIGEWSQSERASSGEGEKKSTRSGVGKIRAFHLVAAFLRIFPSRNEFPVGEKLGPR